MMDCLFLPADCGSPLAAQTLLFWLPREGEGARLSLADCAHASQGRPLALVLPVEVGSAFAVSLPTSFRLSGPVVAFELRVTDAGATRTFAVDRTGRRTGNIWTSD